MAHAHHELTFLLGIPGIVCFKHTNESIFILVWSDNFPPIHISLQKWLGIISRSRPLLLTPDRYLEPWAHHNKLCCSQYLVWIKYAQLILLWVISMIMLIMSSQTPTSNLSMKVQIILHAQGFSPAKCNKTCVFVSVDVLIIIGYSPVCSWFGATMLTMLMCYIYNLKYIYIAGFFVGIQIVYKWDYRWAFVSVWVFLVKNLRILEMNTSLGTCCDRVATLWLSGWLCGDWDLLLGIIGVMGQQSYIKLLIMAKYHNQRDRWGGNPGH